MILAGKTKALVKYISENCRGERILCATFRRTLADKLAADFVSKVDSPGDPSFVNYLDILDGSAKGAVDDYGQFTAPRLVVQADSMLRVKLRGGGIFIADEVNSMVLHTRSSTMKHPTAVLQALEFFICNAKQIILLDASADDMPSFNFVQCIERLIGVDAYWIRNRFQTPMSRVARVHACTSGNPKDKHALQSAALQRVRELVQQGKRVYVPCTSASHCKKLELMLSTDFPDVKVICVTGDDAGSKKRELAMHIDAVLSGVQVAIVSPAMTAGPSFEMEHFTHVVAYAKNAGVQLGPTVDAFLQQLFRVRDLGDAGELDIYVLDPPEVRGKAGPVAECELEAELEVRWEGGEGAGAMRGQGHTPRAPLVNACTPARRGHPLPLSAHPLAGPQLVT